MSSTSQDKDSATIEDLAGLAFEPWRPEPGGWSPPTNAEWVDFANPHLISVRLAWLTLQKSKADLVAMCDELDDEAMTELVKQLGQSADWFEGLHKVLASAECRIMCACAALNADSPDG